MSSGVGIGAGEANRRETGAGTFRVGGALAAIFVAYLLSIWASEILSRLPTVALLLNPQNATALIIQAEAALGRDPPDVVSARRYAEAALKADPLAPRVHSTLARATAASGDEKSADVSRRFSARYARDGVAQFDMLRRAYAARDFDEVSNRLDLLYRGQDGRLWGRLMQALADLIADPEMSAALARKLGEDPPWRRDYLRQIFASASSTDALIRLYSMLPHPQEVESRFFMDRLVREGRHDAAHALFLKMIPPERLGEVGRLYNARFEYGVTNLPFDWVFTAAPNTLIEVRPDRSRRLLRVSFFGGRTPFNNVSHLLALPPGSYTFSGSEQAFSLNNPRGLRWKIACTGRPAETIATTELLVGDVPVRPFEVSFEVGAECPFQLLQLELAARVALEQEVAGTAVYSDFSVAPNPQLRKP